MNPRLADIHRLLGNKAIWGSFPRDMRPLFLAQRGRCPYCPALLSLHTPTALARSVRATGTNRDHVWPARLRGRGPDRTDLVLAHAACNTLKGDRHPHPCEVLFGRFITQISAEIEIPARPRRRM